MTAEEKIFFSGDDTPYKLLSTEHVTVCKVGQQPYLKVAPAGIKQLAQAAFHDVSFYFRPSHLSMLKNILDDPQASTNDRFVVDALLRNAVIAARGVLPTCQDTGTATVIARRGHLVLTDGDDEAQLAAGIRTTYINHNLRYSQVAPISMFEEAVTGDNLPAQVDIGLTLGESYDFLFIAKGGGSASRTALFQKNKSLLTDAALTDFLRENIPLIGTAGCPPYHLALVIGGLSAEQNLKWVKLASAGYLDNLPERGDGAGAPYRDLIWEERVLKIAEQCGLGAQYGGKHFAPHVRVIRLARHAASVSVGIGVSCAADRNIKGKITHEGIFLEQLEYHPARYVNDGVHADTEHQVKIDLDRPIKEIQQDLDRYPINTCFLLSGTMIVARDMAHARLKQQLDASGSLPDYCLNHPIFYAGPAKTPPGMQCGSLGPTTAGRMDSYMEPFLAHGGCIITVAKGARDRRLPSLLKQYGGFYLGTVGGAAALLAHDNILAMEIIDFPELGMEAVYKIRVKDFPVFLVCDNKGNDLFQSIS